MNAFNKRFYACIALIFLVFTAISFENKNLIFFPIFAIFVGVLYWILSKKRQKFTNLKLICVLLLCASLLGVLSSRVQIIQNNSTIEKHSGEHKISGYVIEVASNYSFASEYIVRVEETDGKKSKFDLVGELWTLPLEILPFFVFPERLAGTNR